MKKKENLRKSDIVFGILLAAVSSYFLYLSRAMPTEVLRERTGDIFAFTDPALLPSLVCGVLIVLGILLTIGSLREGARFKKADFTAALAWCRSKASARRWVIIGMFVIYVFALTTAAVAFSFGEFMRIPLP